MAAHRLRRRERHLAEARVPAHCWGQHDACTQVVGVMLDFRHDPSGRGSSCPPGSGRSCSERVACGWAVPVTETARPGVLGFAYKERTSVIMSPMGNTALTYAAIQRTFRNVVVRYLRERMRTAFGPTAEAELKKPFNPEEWTRVRAGAEEPRDFGTVATELVDEFDLVGVPQRTSGTAASVARLRPW